MNLIEQAAAEGVQGFLHPAELEMLMELARGHDVLEIGAFKGLSCWGMAQTARHVWSCDTHRAATNGQRQTTEEEWDKEGCTTLSAFRAATARFDNVTCFVGTSEEAARAGNSVIAVEYDMVFIDAMHDYENVLADLKRWWPRVREGGILACHDHGHGDFPGVELAWDRFFIDRSLEPMPFEKIVTLAWVTK